MKKQVFEKIVDYINKHKADKPFLIGINGIDGSGKSYFASELQVELQKNFNKVVLISIDNFHNPKAIRYEKGKNSPEGFYQNSYNYDGLQEYVLNPIKRGMGQYSTKIFSLEKDEEREIILEDIESDTIFILEGIFLFRKELNHYWDLKIFLDVTFDIALERNIQREKDQLAIGGREQIIAKYNERYMPGQKLYFNEDKPKEGADIIVDNNDYNNPIITRI